MKCFMNHQCPYKDKIHIIFITNNDVYGQITARTGMSGIINMLAYRQTN